MENIIIKNIKKIEQPGKVTFWACESNGKKYTVWDLSLAEIITDNLNVLCEAEIKAHGEFLNIRKFRRLESNNEQDEQIIKAERINALDTVKTPNKAYSKENTIIAQCLFKGAIELVNNSKEFDFEQKCNDSVLAVVKMYKAILNEI